MSAKKILIVDDDPDIIDSLQTILESKGFIISTANSGKQCMEKLAEDKPDLLILDIMMDTDLDGYNYLSKIRQNQNFNNIPIIMLTGISESIGVNFRSAVEDKELFPNVIYMEKPVSAEILEAKIRKLIG